MRSSIACVRCRRSKVKCENEGVGSTCRSCEHSGRECVYPEPIAGTVRRRESVAGGTDGEEERRQRPRKGAHAFAPNLTAAEDSRLILDRLDSNLLTPSVWEELYNIFQLHYSTEFPFTHPPTFMKLVHDSVSVHDHSSKLALSPEFLLAFLALTARFHPKLVAHHSPKTSSRSSNPLIASEYYATLARQSLTSGWAIRSSFSANIQHIQASLMLGLHEWGMCRGAKAWVIVGTAIRYAQVMGLQYEMDLDDEPLSRTLTVGSESSAPERVVLGGSGIGRRSSPDDTEGDVDVFVRQEIKRRTFWSCFIMDRYLSSGKYRPQMLRAKEIRVQLPASEKAFMFSEKVRTLMLGEEENRSPGRNEVVHHRQASAMLDKRGTLEHNIASSPASLRRHESEEEKGRLETGADEGLTSRYIKMLEIYGKVVKWSCNGGRRVEEHPPWDFRSEWYKLHQECIDFKQNLPRSHSLTVHNTQAHLAMGSPTDYILVHTVYLLCQIMLNRDYLPFVPLRCSKPEGPLDPPLFSPDKYSVPNGFWVDSARECFKAARDMVDLITACQAAKKMVETPIVGFATYTIAFVGVYCVSFPWMDPEGYMCTPQSTGSTNQPNPKQSGQSKGFEAAKKSLELLNQLRSVLHMANGTVEIVNRMHKYFRRLKSDYKKNVNALESGSSENDSPVSTRHLSLREGGIGGGLSEFKILERTLQEFGNLEDQPVDIGVTDRRPSSGPFDGGPDDSSAANTVKSEEVDTRLSQAQGPQSGNSNTENGPWNAINAGNNIAVNRTYSQSSDSSQFRSYEPYSQALAPIQSQTQSNYIPQINGLRGSFSHEMPTPGASTSIASPTSRPGTTPGQASPPFDPVYGSRWPPQNPAFPMQPPPPAYANGVQHYQQPGYPTPSPSIHVQNGSNIQAPQPPIAPRDAWYNSVDTRLGGDDFAAFVDGGEMAEFASMSMDRDGAGVSWLSTLWGGNTNPER